MLCEEFSGTPSCLLLHCFDCFCTVYVCERECACFTDCMFVWYVCLCMYRHSISDLSTPLTQLSLGEECPLKILYCLPLVGYSNFSLLIFFVTPVYNKPNYDLIKIIVLLKKHKHGSSAKSVFFFLSIFVIESNTCEDPGSFAAQ